MADQDLTLKERQASVVEALQRRALREAPAAQSGFVRDIVLSLGCAIDKLNDLR
jgi:hypothetical protein